MNLEEKEKIEIDYWKNNSWENSNQLTKENFLNKTQEARILNFKLNKYKEIFTGKKNILEVGSGQGWASSFIKKFIMPESIFTVSDISPHAIDGIKHWESIYNIKIDRREACRSYNTPFDDKSFDIIFCFAAAHHFVKHKETLVELKRILKKDGTIIYLYEPTASKYTYPIYYKYVNSAPHSTPEDVLIPSRMKKIAHELNLSFSNNYMGQALIHRSVLTSLYFKFTIFLGPLKRFLPSSSDLIFKRIITS